MNLTESFWQRFLKTKELPKDTKYFEAFHFELTKKSANDLLKLVLEGKKKATASSLEAYRKEMKNYRFQVIIRLSPILIGNP